MNKIVLGIDISKKKFDVSFKNAQGRWKHDSFDNSSKGFQLLTEWLKSHEVEDVHAVMEATGRYGDALACYFYELNQTVSVVNPARIKFYGRSKLMRAKTDKADAKLIADFGMNNELDFWIPMSANRSKLRELTRCINSLKRDCTLYKNRIEGNHDKDVIKVYKSFLRSIEKKIEKLDQQILDLLDQDEDLHEDHTHLDSIPGIAPRTASNLIAEIPDITLFSHPKQLTALAGLNPSVKQSGTSVRGRGSISKMGNRNLRKALFFPAMSAMQCDPKMKAFAERLRAKGKKGKQVVVACMRKLLETVYWVLKKKEAYHV